MSIRYAVMIAAGACALVLVAPPAAGQDTVAAQWQSVAKTDTQEVFVKTGSIVAIGAQLEARVKQNYVQAQPAAKAGKSYLSSRTTYRFDCAQRRMAMKDVRAFVGSDLQGGEVQKATSSDKNLIWLDAAPKTVFGELLDYVCKATPAAPAG